MKATNKNTEQGHRCQAELQLLAIFIYPSGLTPLLLYSNSSKEIFDGAQGRLSSSSFVLVSTNRPALLPSKVDRRGSVTSYSPKGF